jgi:hypothetical protein
MSGTCSYTSLETTQSSDASSNERSRASSWRIPSTTSPELNDLPRYSDPITSAREATNEKVEIRDLFVEVNAQAVRALFDQSSWERRPEPLAVAQPTPRTLETLPEVHLLVPGPDTESDRLLADATPGRQFPSFEPLAELADQPLVPEPSLCHAVEMRAIFLKSTYRPEFHVRLAATGRGQSTRRRPSRLTITLGSRTRERGAAERMLPGMLDGLGGQMRRSVSTPDV